MLQQKNDWPGHSWSVTYLNKMINHQKGKIFWQIPAVICTIHEPPCIRRNVDLWDCKIEVCQHLRHFKEAMLVHTINRHHITQETVLISFVHRTERDSSFSFKLMYLYYCTIIHTFIVNVRQREMEKFGFGFNWFWRRVFQYFNFVSSKQEACAYHVQQNFVKYNSKNNTGVQSVISVIVEGAKCAVR